MFRSEGRAPARRTEGRLRVVKLTSYLPRVGGGELQTHALSRALKRIGVRVTVLDTRGESEDRLCSRVDGVPILRYRAPGYPVLDVLCQQAALRSRLRRLIGTIDVVQVNHLGPALLAARAVSRRRGVPLLLVLWGSCRPGVGPFRRGPHRSYLRAVARRADGIVALSYGMARNLERRWGFPPSRLEVIPNGVDTLRFHPRPGAARPDGMPSGPVAISVGRLVPAKRYDLLVQAFRSVVARYPRASLVLIGEGPLRRDLERVARDSGVAEHVVLAGRRGDVEYWLAAADVYVSSSENEGMSNALLEAMSSGLPVVATRVSGSEDLVLDGSTGRLVDPGAPQHLALPLLELLDHPDERRRLGEAARSRIESSFSLPAVAERYRRTYERLTAGRPLAGGVSRH